MALPEPGTLFESRYRLDEVLGAGGFATVYKATDTRSGRHVAIKVLRPDAGGYPATLKARFEREIRLLGSLRDEHTLTLFDHGLSRDGLLFMVTEYIEGEDLEALLERRGRLEPAEVVRILRQVLTALHEAHNAGLLHRDIKPGNVRVYSYMGDELRVMLLDFGIAREVEGHERLTSDGELVGTLRYMSPEQLMSAPLSPASDIYSLGVVAFELLGGSDGIHGGRVHDQLERLATGHLFSTPELRRLGSLAPILDKMTARSPHDRFQSAQQVLTALDEPEPPIAPRPSASATERAAPSAETSSDRWMMGLGVLGGLGLMGAATGVWLMSDVADPVPTPTVLPSALLTTRSKVPGPPRQPIVTVQPADVGPLERTPISASPGCGDDPGFEGAAVLSVRDEFDVRTVPAFIPRTYEFDKPTSLVVMLHEHAERPQEFMEYSRMKPIAAKHGFILIAPDGGFPLAWTEEEATIRSVRRGIDTAMDAACIDPDRVFVIGHGAGGRAAELVGAHIQAVRAVATTSHRDTVREKLPTTAHVPPYLHIAPMKDKYNLVEGGNSCDGPEDYLSLAEQERRWRLRHGCKAPRKDWLERGPHRCLAWTCDVPFVSCHLDGGRNWPGLPNRIWDSLSGQNCDGTPAKFPFAQTIWRFFEEQAPRKE